MGISALAASSPALHSQDAYQRNLRGRFGAFLESLSADMRNREGSRIL